MKRQNFILLLILVIAFFLRFPSLFEPNWYGDEGIYQVMGQVVHQGGLLYRDVWDNKPPLLYLIYALFDGNQFSVRLVSLGFTLVTIIIFFFLAKKLFKEENISYISTSLFAFLFAIPLLEGNIANAENFMYLPIIGGMYLGLTTMEQKQGLMKVFVAGLFLGIAFLIKIVAVFDLGALLFFLFAMVVVNDRKEWFTRSFLLSLGFALPVVLTILYFFSQGALVDFITAAFFQNVTYIGAGNKFLFGQGLLILKLLLLSISSFIIFFSRNKLSWQYIFIYLWLEFSLFNTFFGGRPWGHYLLTLLPAFCLLIGMVFANRKLRVGNIIIVVIILFMIRNFWFYGKTLSYYPNFIAYATGSKSVEQYRGFFDWFVNRDYEVAQYIRNNSNVTDRIFIWGDNAQIYAISDRLPLGRYTVSYHITFYPNALYETKQAIEQKKPHYIVAIRDDFPQSLLDNSYVFIKEIQGAKIFKRA